MELSDWCEQVPHGQYFQPIRLRLDGPVDNRPVVSAPVAIAATTIDVAQEAPSTPPPNGGSPMAESPSLTTPKRLKRRPKPAPTTPQTPRGSDLDRDGVVLLPPFQSAHIGVDRMVLNVGGPLWAMDWLPHDVYRATATAATKQKKASASSKNKENVCRNVHGSAASSAKSGSSSTKDPLAEWRLLALSTHPPCTVVDDKLVKNTPPEHYYDAPQGGRGLIQIWAIPVAKPPPTHKASDGDPSTEQESAPRQPPRAMPRLVYAIDHDCGVAWDLHWAPLTHKMPRHRQSDALLGVLAVAFGDGSMQIFEIPVVQQEKLQLVPNEHVVERLKPVASGKIDKIIQLSVRWSPHRWNLLLTGCSDGSVALWNLEELLSKSPSEADDETFELEPQRRFQDADTVGKQEPFDWGWGWVAVRAVCWSPLDENLFATTGNDSLFKLWDIREPRICFRSHRIRSTWGLALQWMDDTFVQISGDQGSIYTYDVLSGSYQKLHFHPQIDSPVWDLQFARGGRQPLLVSCCTSGSVRLAPGKKIFRAPQNSLEICRLQGEKISNVELPHKSLTLSFEQRILSGSAEAASPATREFCERDASLHCVAMSTMMPDAHPCFLATGGHAGLVVIMEMQDELDHVYEKCFLQRNKKIGRPRKAPADKAKGPWGRGAKVDKSKKVLAPPKIKRLTGSSGSLNLSSFAHGTAKSGLVGRGKVKPRKVPKESQSSDFPEFEMESEVSEPEDPDNDGESSESESEEMSLGDDNSDDDRMVGSDGSGEEDEDGASSLDAELLVSPEIQQDARMRHEYQLDLSEEDAMMLAIQMSEMDQTTPSTPSTAATVEQRSQDEDSETGKEKKTATAASSKTTKHKREQKPSASKQPKDGSEDSNDGPINPKAKLKQGEEKKPTKPTTKVNGSAAKAAATGSSSSKPPRGGHKALSPQQPAAAEFYVDETMDQASIQMSIYQQGMSEEDALREAIRMSEMGVMRRSDRKRKAPEQPSPSSSSAFARPTTASLKKAHKSTATPLQRPNEKATGSVEKESPEEVARRLEFANSPQLSAIPRPDTPTVAVEEEQVGLQTASKSDPTPQEAPKTPAQAPKARAKPPPSSGKKKATPRKVPVVASSTDNGSVESTSTPSDANVPAEAAAAAEGAAFTTPTAAQSKKNAKRPSTASKSTAKKQQQQPSSSSKKHPKSKRASQQGMEQFLTEEELMAMALQMSQIEF